MLSGLSRNWMVSSSASGEKREEVIPARFRRCQSSVRAS